VTVVAILLLVIATAGIFFVMYRRQGKSDN
jgi:preprotein translocase subunit YajC